MELLDKVADRLNLETSSFAMRLTYKRDKVVSPSKKAVLARLLLQCSKVIRSWRS